MKIYFPFYYGEFGHFYRSAYWKQLSVLTFASSRSVVPYLSEFWAEYCNAWAPRWMDEREGGRLAFKGPVYIFISNYCLWLFLFRFYKHCFLPKPKSETKLHRHLIEEAKPLKSKCVGLSAAHSSQQEGYSFMGTRAVTCGQKKWPVVPSSPVWCLQQRPDQMLLWKIKRKKTKGRHHCKQLQGSRNSREVSSPKAGCWHMLCSHGRRRLATSYRIKP